jgi:hypothetical protein
MSAMLRRVGAEAVAAAAAAGYEGIELDVGREAEEHPLFTDAGLAALWAELARTGLAVPSVCLGALNAFGFKSADPAERARAHALITRGVALARTLGAGVVLVPFFGSSRLESVDEVGRVVEGIRGVASAARDAGVVLAVENTLPAPENAALGGRLLHRQRLSATRARVARGLIGAGSGARGVSDARALFRVSTAGDHVGLVVKGSSEAGDAAGETRCYVCRGACVLLKRRAGVSTAPAALGSEAASRGDVLGVRRRAGWTSTTGGSPRSTGSG